MYFSTEQRALFLVVAAAAHEEGVRACVVGGVVRDLLLGQSMRDRDVDFLIEGSALRVAERVASGDRGTVLAFPKFLTAKIRGLKDPAGIDEVDFATARTESYPAPGKLPEVRAASIEQDLLRRDFTVNACALPLSALLSWIDAGQHDIGGLHSALLDQHGGLTDLGSRTIRTLHPRSFIDDPTRIFRAARYTARLRGAVAAQTARELADALKDRAMETISPARTWNELRKLIAEPEPSRGISLLEEWEVARHSDFLGHVVWERMRAALRTLDSEEGGERARRDPLAQTALFLGGGEVELQRQRLLSAGVSRRTIEAALSLLNPQNGISGSFFKVWEARKGT
jgi:tRNA nucleotidyltransferase/poly(A) polymerase